MNGKLRIRPKEAIKNKGSNEELYKLSCTASPRKSPGPQLDFHALYLAYFFNPQMQDI